MFLHFRDGKIAHQSNYEVAILTAQFPSDFPRDPADRIIAATARGVSLVTADERIQACTLVKTIW
jgi:PIN domain nuclease of toxin-antitoxin system